MKKIVLGFLFVIFFTLNINAKNNDYSQKIIGNWVIDSIDSKELVVKNNNLRASIEDYLISKKKRLEGQAIEFKTDGTFIITSQFGKDKNPYKLEGDKLTLYIGGQVLTQKIENVTDSTLVLYMDETDIYKEMLPYLFPDYPKASISKAVTRYIYKK